MSKLREVIVVPTKMSPSDYCRKWVPEIYKVYPNDWSYRNHCLIVLSRVTGYGVNTINNWGSDFENVPKRSSNFIETCLAMSDALNRIYQQSDPFYPQE